MHVHFVCKLRVHCGTDKIAEYSSILFALHGRSLQNPQLSLSSTYLCMIVHCVPFVLGYLMQGHRNTHTSEWAMQNSKVLQ